MSQIKTMMKLDPQKLGNLPTVNDDLNERYGMPGTPERDKFNEETIAAIEEACNGKLRDVPAIDTSSVEAMVKSMGLSKI